MNTISRLKMSAAVAGAALALAGCAGMSERDRDTAIGAGVGAVGGSVLSGGSAAGTVGGAVVGGVVGNQVGRNKEEKSGGK